MNEWTLTPSCIRYLRRIAETLQRSWNNITKRCCCWNNNVAIGFNVGSSTPWIADVLLERWLQRWNWLHNTMKRQGFSCKERVRNFIVQNVFKVSTSQQKKDAHRNLRGLNSNSFILFNILCEIWNFKSFWNMSFI